MAVGWHTSSTNGVASKADPTVVSALPTIVSALPTIVSALQTIASALESTLYTGALEGESIVTIDCAGVESGDEFDGQCVLYIEHPTPFSFNQFNGKGILTT